MKTLINNLSASLSEYAKEFDIKYVEHLVSVFSSTQISHLINSLNLSTEKSTALIAKIEKIRSEYLTPSQKLFTSGYKTFGLSADTMASYKPKPMPINAVNIKAKVDLLAHNTIPIKDQGALGTCVAHSLTRLIETQADVDKAMAPAFVYFFAKQLDGNQEDEGTTLNHGLEAMKQYGVCEEGLFPYHSLVNSEARLLKPSQIALKLASKNKINDFVVCSAQHDDNPIHNLKLILSGALSGKPRTISCAIAMYMEQLNSFFSQKTGDVCAPIWPDGNIYHHALTLIGLHDSKEWRGGGYALFVESHGPDFAEEGEFGSGIRRMSYQCLLDTLISYGTFLFAGEKEAFFEDINVTKTPIAATPTAIVQASKHAFTFNEFDNNFISIYGATGVGKTTLSCDLIEQAYISQPHLRFLIMDPTAELKKRLQHLNPTIIDVEENGLPFPFIDNLRGNALDIKLKSLINDLNWSSMQLGVHQKGALRAQLTKIMKGGSCNNLKLKEFLQANLDEELLNHIEDFLLILRSSQTIDITKPGIYISDLSALDEAPISRALYAIATLRQAKNTQFKDSTIPCMLVFEEADLLLNNRSSESIKRFVQEARKFNMGAFFISQLAPKQDWLKENLRQCIELKADKTYQQSSRVPLDFKAVATASFTAPKSFRKENVISRLVERLIF